MMRPVLPNHCCDYVAMHRTTMHKVGAGNSLLTVQTAALVCKSLGSISSTTRKHLKIKRNKKWLRGWRDVPVGKILAAKE